MSKRIKSALFFTFVGEATKTKTIFYHTMNLHLQIHYNTTWGQQLCVVLRYQRRDGIEREQLLTMDTADGSLWQLDHVHHEQQRQRQAVWFEYHYELHDADHNVLRREWNVTPRRYYNHPDHNFTMDDQWRDYPLAQHYYTSAYRYTTKPQFSAADDMVRTPIFTRTILFRVSAPGLKPGEALALLGNQPPLGDWNERRYLPMHRLGLHDWVLSVSADGLRGQVEYKFVKIDTEHNTLLEWEQGNNRSVDADAIAPRQVHVVYGDSLHLQEPQWRKSGVVVPLFSLRTDHTWGVGDFGALRQMIDWCRQAGISVLQLLPVNDTTLSGRWEDSDPYNPVCSFALHPHYLDLHQVGELNDAELQQQFMRQQHELNAMATSDYEKVHLVKLSYLYHIYLQQGSQDFALQACQDFIQANDWWLTPYSQWQSEHDASNPPQFFVWLQYHLHSQFRTVADYARSQGVILKGDLAIGISRQGIDMEIAPGVFDADNSIGTPPDRDNPHGSNWQFPAYRWAEAPELCTQWWRKRLEWMAQYFDAVRVDHVLGFFRLWQIPAHALSATLGHYAPSQPLSVDEIGYYGLPFRHEYMTRPFINDTILTRIFGIHTQYVKDNFLHPGKYGHYHLRPEVATQQGVMQHFRGAGDEDSLWIREGLMQLLCNVLFVADENRPNHYHPRIHAYNAPVFHTLSDEEREAYMRLYNHYYYERHEHQWMTQAYQRLSTIFGDTSMLICVEDLGQMPHNAATVLDSMRMLTLQLPILPRQQEQEFNPFKQFPVRSVCTFSTHDMAPLRLWWQENPARAQRFYQSVLLHDAQAPQPISQPLAEEVIARLYYSPSMLCVISIQDLLAISTTPLSTLTGNRTVPQLQHERINNPADPYNHWNYRLPLTIEQLSLDSALLRKLQSLAKHSKRS